MTYWKILHIFVIITWNILRICMLPVVGYIHSFHYGQKFVSRKAWPRACGNCYPRAHNRAEIVFLAAHAVKIYQIASLLPFHKELNQLNTADFYVNCRFIESERSCHGFWTAYCLCWDRPNSNSFGTTVLYLNVVKKTFLPRPILVQQNWTWGTCWATLESAMLFARQRASLWHNVDHRFAVRFEVSDHRSNFYSYGREEAGAPEARGQRGQLPPVPL